MLGVGARYIVIPDHYLLNVNTVNWYVIWLYTLGPGWRHGPWYNMALLVLARPRAII